MKGAAQAARRLAHAIRILRQKKKHREKLAA